MKVKSMKDERIICAGFGGQGIMILGKLIAYSVMEKNYNVTWMPSYGAEVRGGTAHCMVIVSDKEIASPITSYCDTAIILNNPSMDKFHSIISPRSVCTGRKGLVLLNSSLVTKELKRKDIDILRLPMTEIALELGNIRAANMVALGAYMKLRGLFVKKDAIKGIRIAFAGNKEIIDINIRALDRGEALA